MAGNLLLFDEISYLSAAIYALFVNVRAYAIRPYNYSVEIKHITTKYFIENSPYHHFWSAIYAFFVAMRAYAIRPYTRSLEIKHITPKYFVENSPLNHTISAKLYLIRRHEGVCDTPLQFFAQILTNINKILHRKFAI